MSKKETTAIVKADSYKILAIGRERREELMRQNVGTGGVSEFDLPRVKIPTGGVTIFEVPTLVGSEFFPSIEGVIVGWSDVRVYWKTAYGEGEGGPPDCTSDNSHGVGSPGGACEACPFAQFGSNPKEGSKGQACQQRRILMLMRPGSLLPLIISLPPTSLKNARRFNFQLLDGEKVPHEVIVSIGLEKDKNTGGKEYAKATFKVVETLPAEVAKQFAEIRDSFGPQMQAAVKEEASPVDVVGPEERKRRREAEEAIARETHNPVDVA